MEESTGTEETLTAADFDAQLAQAIRGGTGMTIIGVDPSVRKTGVAVRTDGALRTILVETDKTGLEDPGRLVYIVQAVAAIADMRFRERALLVIEGTGRTIGPNRINLGLHWVLRVHLARCATLGTLVVPPATLKKFATASGTAAKGEVGAHVMRRWGDELPTVPSEDVLEAFALLKIGECYLDTANDWPDWPTEPTTKWTAFQLSAIAKLTIEWDGDSVSRADVAARELGCGWA